MKQPKKQQARMTFDDLEHWVHEDVMLENEEPSAIATEVSKLLSELNDEDVFVVHRLAKDFASAIAFELAFKDGDMVEVVKKQGAVLELMTAWLKRHGVNRRSLRPAGRVGL
jgi:hypothetical protein